jgi:hypothetical protein
MEKDIIPVNPNWYKKYHFTHFLVWFAGYWHRQKHVILKQNEKEIMIC